LSELNKLIKTVDQGLENYEITESARALEAFVDVLSNWYVRRCRERYWGSEWTQDKKAAYCTLYNVLVTLTKLTAPFVPFISESIYQNLVPNFFADAPKSVHLCSFPVADESAIDEELNQVMQQTLSVVVLGRSARNAVNIKNRQPLAKLYVAGANKLDDEAKSVICEELNVKELEAITDASAFASYEIKPQLRTLGPKYGKILGQIRNYFANLGDKAKQLVDTVNAGDKYTFEVDGNVVEVGLEDVLINSQNKQGYSIVADKVYTVALETTLTDELVEEGLEREIVSKIQTMRKESDFVVTDRIVVKYQADQALANVMEKYATQIAQDTLASVVEQGEGGTYSKQWDVNGYKLTLFLSKAN
jgi:isoleucyl-tRNA synthetase